MDFFSKLLNLLSKSKERREFIAFYQDLYLLSTDLIKDIEEILLIKRSVLLHPWLYEGNDATGMIGLKKGVFMEEILLPKLKYFEKIFLNAEKNAKHTTPDAVSSEAQKLELERVMMFLEEVRQIIPSENAINKARGLGDGPKIEWLGNTTRRVTELAKKFNLTEEQERLAKAVAIQEIDPLIRRVFDRATKENQFKAYVIKKEFNAIAKEAKQINALENPKYRIFWRSWWRKYPKFETDQMTDIKEPHANITMILGGQKKEVHLILR